MEQPVDLKPRKGKARKGATPKDKRICIIHMASNTEKDVRQMKEEGFEKIKDVAKIRLSQVDTKHHLDHMSKHLPESFDPALHGSHRRCYQMYTHINRLTKKRSSDVACMSSSDPQPSTSKSRRTSSSLSVSSPLFPSDKCLFCGNQYVKFKGKRQYLIKCVTKTASDSIFAAAETKQDETMLCKIRGKDIVAREAHYHGCCRREYIRLEQRHPKSPELLKSKETHSDAFEYICKYIEEAIITDQKVERLSMIRERYLKYILEHHPKDYSENYRSFKLKDKLVNHFGARISFWQASTNRSQLVYTSAIHKGQSIEVAFELACSDEKRLEEAAMILRRHIENSKQLSGDMPWPPSSCWLLSNERQPPFLLEEFLSFVISGKSQKNISRKSSRQIHSVAQDICYVATNGEWVMPKHILLPMTVRHLTGSAELVTILNRFGHGQSYTRTLEVETAMCNTITASKSLLPSNISTENNSVIHFCWDNFGLNEETPSGMGTTHSTHGIVIQEVTEVDQTRDVAPIQTKERLKVILPEATELQPCFAKQKAEPNFVVSQSKPVCDFNTSEFHNFIWLLCRNIGSTMETQIVPPWTGWLSKTSAGSNPICSTVEYMPPINFSIYENATVQHILETSKEASLKLGQRYTIVTFDLAVAKKAYSIVWQNPQRFGNVIVRMGIFHTICSLFGALGSKMKGSGLSEILIESSVCASGSLEKVMSGKHYNRALRVHKLTVEALEHLLLCKFEESEYSQETSPLHPEAIEMFQSLTENPSSEMLNRTMGNEHCRAYFEAYQAFKASVRAGILGETAQFWVSYMDAVWLILMLIKSTKSNDLDLHIAALYKLCPLLFAFDHHNYARYLPVYLMMLMNLKKTHPGSEELLRKNGFSVCRSSIPLSRNAVDITIEQTINRHTKCQGGIIGFSRNYAAYYRWCVTRHYRAKLVEATLSLADMSSTESSLHKELQPSQIKNSEHDTKKVVEAFNNFTNPFSTEIMDEVFCLSSGKPAPQDVKTDVLRADDCGRAAMETFIKERMVEKSVPFHDPIKRQKLKPLPRLVWLRKLNPQTTNWFRCLRKLTRPN